MDGVSGSLILGPAILNATRGLLVVGVDARRVVKFIDKSGRYIHYSLLNESNSLRRNGHPAHISGLLF